LPDNSILITANMQSETGFPSSHQLKSYVASKSRLKLSARAVLSADAGLLVFTYSYHTSGNQLWLVQPDSCYNTGRTVDSETWRRCDDAMNLFVEKRWVFIVLCDRL